MNKEKRALRRLMCAVLLTFEMPSEVMNEAMEEAKKLFTDKEFKNLNQEQIDRILRGEE